MDELVERFNQWAKEAQTEDERQYYSTESKILASSGFKSRAIGICGGIEQLAGF